VAAFVTDGNLRSSLAVVRALGRAGIPVIVGESHHPCLAGSSKHCTERSYYPSPQDDPAGFQRALGELAASGRFNVLQPMSDVTMQLVAGMRSTLPPTVRIPIPDEQVILSVQDKRFMVQQARQVGIGCPQTVTLEGGEDIQAVARGLTYPVVIKPRFSRYLNNGVWVTGPVVYARDPQDLVAKYESVHRLIPRPLIQEMIPGEGRGIFLLVWGGELKAALCHRRLREKPPWGGVSVYSETVPLDSALVQQSLELLQAIHWQGPAMVEFKLDKREGRAKFMEVNGRFWGSLQLAIDAGVNFPLLLYRLALGESVPAQRDYRVGIKSRWLLGDLDSLLIRLRGRNWPNGLPGSDRSKLKATLDFLKLYESNSCFDVLRFGDLGPGWFEFKDYVRATLRSLRRPSSAAVSSEGRST